VVLIGPVCTGKSTLLAPVAERLGVDAVDLDDVANAYYEEVGRGREALRARGDAFGFLDSYLWWQEAHPHAVRRALADFPAAAVALGAGHTDYDDERLFDEVASCLAGAFPVLVLPSPDLDRSVAVLRARSLEGRSFDWRRGGRDFIERWVKGPHNRRLARATVFTEGRAPGEAADEIVARARAAAAEGPARKGGA
jgi:hypothetical protein